MTYMKVHRTLLSCAILAIGFRLGAQQAAVVEFEVASIKPNKSNTNSSGIHHSHGLWRANNNTVKSLIINAFEVLPEQIAGAPPWIDSDRFDIEAKYEENSSASNADNSKQTQLRLQALLSDRFKLQIHRETKEWQSYVLVAGKKGPKLAPTEKKEGSSMNSNNGHMECKGVTIENLARNLAFRLGRPVVNETALEGRFDFTLDFEPEGPARIGEKDNPIAGVDARKPSLFTAVQDQLGLKLESRKAPVEMLVVDRIERPSDN